MALICSVMVILGVWDANFAMSAMSFSNFFWDFCSNRSYVLEKRWAKLQRICKTHLKQFEQTINMSKVTLLNKHTQRYWHEVIVSYLFTNVSLYMAFSCSACHRQNRQLASNNPRITTWPLDRALAIGFTWLIVHEGGRWHSVLEPSVSAKNKREATSRCTATVRMTT